MSFNNYKDVPITILLGGWPVLNICVWLEVLAPLLYHILLKEKKNKREGKGYVGFGFVFSLGCLNFLFFLVRPKEWGARPGHI